MSVEIEGTADEIGTDIAIPEQPAPLNLFHTSDPVEVLEKAARVADALKGVIDQRQLFKRIGNKDHVLVEGWATCGAMLGLTAATVWSRPVGEPSSEKGHDWEARVEVRTLDGRVIGAAEAMCTRKESTWKSRDDYALRSMAQTRATSKALRGPLGFIVTLAGYSATPAEEMPPEGSQWSSGSQPTVKDVEHVERSDVTAADPWVEAIKARASAFRGELREAVIGLGGTVPENVSSWGRVLATLDAAQRRAFEHWLTTREEQHAQVPWSSEPVVPTHEDQLAITEACHD